MSKILSYLGKISTTIFLQVFQDFIKVSIDTRKASDVSLSKSKALRAESGSFCCHAGPGCLTEASSKYPQKCHRTSCHWGAKLCLHGAFLVLAPRTLFVTSEALSIVFLNSAAEKGLWGGNAIYPSLAYSHMSAIRLLIQCICHQNTVIQPSVRPGLCGQKYDNHHFNYLNS